MRSSVLVFAIICVFGAAGCARPADGEQQTKNSQTTKQPAPSPPTPAPSAFSREIPATFPVYTAEVEKEIKSLRAGEWIPVTIDRPYLILRGSGIRLEAGPYFVQLLSDAKGNITKFLIAKKRDIKLQDVNLAKAAAKDGSFAEVMNFGGIGHMGEKFKDTRAYVVSSGESGAVWVHVTGSELQLEGEVMGLASHSKKPQVAQ